MTSVVSSYLSRRGAKGCTVLILMVLGATIMFLYNSTKDNDSYHAIPLKIKSVACLAKDETCLERKICRHKIKSTVQALSTAESSNYLTCVYQSDSDYKMDNKQFWTGSTQYIRHTHHSYLNSNSIILDVGGNVGEDAKAFIDKFNPRKYVIIEPLFYLYERLKKKFKDKENVIIYNIGVGIKDTNVSVRITGNEGDATSQFMGSGFLNLGSRSVRHVVNATEFLIRLGVGCIEFDLVTVNCEGCEFEFLEALLSTNLVTYFKNIQFATHPTLKYLYNPMQRYCEIQERLARTHERTYQYRFTWENWQRKEKHQNELPI